MNYQLIDIRSIRHPTKGAISFFEGSRDIPFEIRRIYYIYDADANVERGGHAHKNLERFLFCPYGHIEIVLDDGIHEKETVVLKDPVVGLYIPKAIWIDIKWLKKDSVLCVAASDYYDESEYIRNYDDFLKHVNNKGKQCC